MTERLYGKAGKNNSRNAKCERSATAWYCGDTQHTNTATTQTQVARFDKQPTESLRTRRRLRDTGTRVGRARSGADLRVQGRKPETRDALGNTDRGPISKYAIREAIQYHIQVPHVAANADTNAGTFAAAAPAPAAPRSTEPTKLGRKHCHQSDTRPKK